VRQEEEMNSDEAVGNGMQIRVMSQGANDIVYYDFTNAARTDQRELFDKKILVSDTIQKLNWKLTGQTRNILGYTCQQATAQRIGVRIMTNMDNGKLERKQVADTANITAWFAPDIAIPAGPDVPGQLPGLILALDINNGRTVYQALEISLKANIAAIVPPTKGKKVTPAEFREELDKMMKEMQKNNNGRNGQVIRIGS
jgi:GLPGLI family protein